MATSLEPTPSQLQARLAHLEVIQGIISRMATQSSTLKNFSLTTSAAILALTVGKKTASLWYAPIGITALFMILDAYYLAQERLVREVYDTVSRRDWSEATDLRLSVPRASFANVLRALLSPSICLFYIPVSLGLALLFWHERG